MVDIKIKELLDEFKEKLTLDGRNKVFEQNYKLSSNFLIQKSDPEAFTKEFLIEPIIKKFELSKLLEKHFRGIKGDLRKVDYILKNQRNTQFLAEAKPLNSDLFEKGPNGAVNQIKGLFRLAEVKENYEFGIATDGLKWIFIDKNSKVVFQYDLKQDLDKIREILIGKEEVSSERIEEEISKKFYVWYNALLHGGKYKDHENRTRTISSKDCLVENILFVSKFEDREQIAQTVMDRLIFIKFLQSKGIVKYDVLEYLIKLDENILNEKLKQLFFQVLNTKKSERINVDLKFKDIPYLNGSLFVRTNAELKNLDYKIRAFILREVIKFLDSFKFVHTEDLLNKKILDPEILGYIFERAMNSKDRKGTGAYYTPKIITYYIAKNTIYSIILKKVNIFLKEKGWKNSELINNIEEIYRMRSPKILGDINNKIILNLKICDNACGSGAFLLAAADILLNIYKKIREVLRLKTSEIGMRKLILKNNLYGVDINPNAIEITKLRLWLWLVTAYEPNNVEPLPNIDYNLRIGNSLIGYINIDKFKNQKLTLLDWNSDKTPLNILLKKREEIIIKYKDAIGNKARNLKKEIEDLDKKIKELLDINFYQELTRKININKEEFKRINIFHWGFEFYDIFNNEEKGFDVIIGNPPYFSIDPKLKRITTKEYLYFRNFYKTFHGQTDIFVFFYERGINLLKQNGILGFISKNRWQNSPSYNAFCDYLINKHLRIIDFDDTFVFMGVGVTTNIILINKNEKPNIEYWLFNNSSINNLFNPKYYEINKEIKIRKGNWDLLSNNITRHLEKVGQKILVGGCGHKTTPSKIFILALSKNGFYPENNEIRKKYGEILKFSKKEKKFIRSFASSGDIFPYFIKKRRFIIYTKDLKLDQLKNLKDYFSKVIKNKEGRSWYEYHSGRGYRNIKIINSNSKIIFPQRMYLNRKSSFMLVNRDFQIGMDCGALISSDPNLNLKYILAILNSKLMWYFYRRKFKRYANRQTIEINKIPIKKITIKEQKPFIDLVNQILSITKSKDYLENKQKQAKVKELQDKIDKLVYKLYGLMDKEIKIVEESLK